MSTVELLNLRKVYGATQVLHDVSLSIGEGEFVALVGPSGCGKSTMLRMIAGLEEITAGEVRIAGRKVNGETPKQRNIAMVFQNYALYPHMSVRQNIGLNLKIAGHRPPQIAEKVEAAAKLLDIVELLDRRPSELSGGQRQRVAMGRAIVRNPAAFLFDEPLSNLDAKLRVQMRSEIKALHAAVKTTSIYVTHDQIEAMTLADRVVVLNKGRIEQQGSAIELYQNPSNMFVAGFIGSPAMNFLEASVSQANGQVLARIGATSSFPLDSSLALADGQKVVLGIRPEHLTFEQGAGPLRGNVTFVEPTGATTLVFVTVDGMPLTAMTVGISHFQTGESVALNVAPANVFVFDRETELRIRR